jgi:ABC-type dipeptide transport system, periplasmic component
MIRVPSDVSRHQDGRASSKVRLLSRRAALGLFGGAGAALVLGPLLDRSVVLAADNLKKGGQVVVALSQEPTVFNPVRPHIEVDHGVHFGLFDSLWRVDERAQFSPNLATEVPSTGTGASRRTASSTPSSSSAG